ncbi:hypothetical protein Tco_1429395 [Tanacetum coccineum]
MSTYPKPSVLGKPTPFSNSPEMRSFQTKQSVNKTNVSDGLFKQVTQQNLPLIRKQAVRNTNVIAPGPSRNCPKHVSHQSPREKVGSNDMVHNLPRGTSFNGQKQQRIDITADALYNEKQENLRVWLLKFLISKKPVPECSSLGRQCQMASAENNTSGPVPQFKFKAGSKSCSLSSQDSYITTRVGITIPPSYSNAEDNSHKVVRLGINPMIQPEPEDLPKDNPKLEIAVLRVILFSIHNDEWKSFQCHHQTALRTGACWSKIKRSQEAKLDKDNESSKSSSQSMIGIIPKNLLDSAAALAILITGASQSRQHGMSEPARRSLID